MEPVLDSSRYFVLRVDGDGGKRAYIGMGFQERGDAFDFQVGGAGLYTVDMQVALQAVSKRSTTTVTEATKPAAAPKDYSLKEGQTFSIKIPGREGKKAPSTGGVGGGLFSLPPPPPPGGRRN